ncbi:opioid-binding protein/cell adhesion molecule-like [Ptychodera flava]|uniref:opioid-binding protein/cell adhesion molecule-like n=1 Tax=Ptychodera flava TaxID=63121 RepID=UPI00396A1E47
MTVTPFINITEGDEVTIHCEALDGNPAPHILELLFEDNSPKFVSDELEFVADIGDDVSISCEVHGFPMPAIKWFDQNSDIITGEEENLNITVRLSETLVKSTLTVTVADESYYGRYTCKATNDIPPDDEQTMEIVKPGSNADTVAVAVTCTVIVVVLIVGIVLGILFYNKRVSKKQSNNTDYANAG